MIKNKTVFIIGAGSNILYGFPSGRTLRHNIIKNFIADLDSIKRMLPIGYGSTSKSFINEFQESNIQSIDKFLTLRPEFYDIGKMAIAIEILKAEKDSKFAEELEKQDFSKDWYFHLYNKMLDEIDCTEDYIKFKDNSLSFVTFNYDRSLDYYLYNSFFHSFSPDIFKRFHTAKIFPFKIIHVYGSPELEWQKQENYLDYNRRFEYDERTVKTVLKMADSIRIINDERNHDDTILKAQELIINSERIFFLGFGYAKENLEMLGIPNTLKGKEVYGTVFGYTENEICNVSEKIGLAQNPSKNLIRTGHGANYCVLKDVDCMMLLRNYL